jgi:hypothetical protein
MELDLISPATLAGMQRRAAYSFKPDEKGSKKRATAY